MFPSQKFAGSFAPPTDFILLQWGRDVSIPEIGRDGIQQFRGCLLQWGRDVSIPEICLFPKCVHRPALLQWGRDVSIPEMMATAIAIVPGGPGFNGAGMFPSQKCRSEERRVGKDARRCFPLY